MREDYKVGDECFTTYPVVGAEEYLVGGVDCSWFFVTKVGHKGYPLAKFRHRVDAEEYAKWLHNGQVGTPVYAIDVVDESFATELMREICKFVGEGISAGREQGLSDAAHDMATKIGIDKYIGISPKKDGDEFCRMLQERVRRYADNFVESLRKDWEK